MAGRTLHRESLLNIPLLAQMLDDPGFAIVRRGIDSRWSYEDCISTRVEGFNPLRAAAFIGTHSHFDRWLPHRHGSARRFNRDDGLVSEALFVVHDYLHAWAYRWIAELRPELAFGRRPITRRNLDAMAFCHLLSEAAATVGLDYWYLSVVDLAREVPIGTLQRGLTVSYREGWSGEYRRFNPGLEVQHPSFFARLARFYCDGVFQGFSAQDLRASPAIDAWIAHELNYGRLQRRYCRQWLCHLSAETLNLSEAEQDAPIPCEAGWQRRLADALGERLWAKVKDGEMCAPPGRPDPQGTWTAPPGRAPDFRFVNLNRHGRLAPAAVKAMPEDSFDYLMRQYVSRFDFAAFPPAAMGVFKMIREDRDFGIGDRLLKGFRRLPVARAEPPSLILYN